MSVKTYQHRKAIGNARTTARAFMTPILRDIAGQDVMGQAETPYGPEKATVPAGISVNLATGAGILAMGRLERMSADAVEGDVRLSNKEAYRLYWLPFDWSQAEGDYAGNPQKLGPEINSLSASSVDFVVSGSRIWIVVDSNGLSDLSGCLAREFVVVDSFRNGVADLVEYEATVYRSEGTVPRAVTLL
ncbi:MAG: hypothetical protein ABL984_00290 [Pyrinomonadaceae bacterium]